MRVRIALVVICFLFASGCLVKSKCSVVNQTVNVTEVHYTSTPRNVTENYSRVEPYLVERYDEVPLAYEVVRDVNVFKELVTDEYGERIEYGRVGQTLNGTLTIILLNNDSIGGLFQTELTLERGNTTVTESETVYVNVNESQRVIFEFDFVRGVGWSYQLKVVPPTRTVKVDSVAYHEVNRTRVVTVLDSVREEVVRTVVQQVEVC